MKNKWRKHDDGFYYWKCKCGKGFKKSTPQGLGIARSNHLRHHGISTVNGRIINE